MKEPREVTTGEKVSYILYTLVVIMAYAIGLAIVIKMVAKPAIILLIEYFSDYSLSIFKMAFVLFGFILSVIVAFYISDPAGMLTKFIPGYAKPKIFEFMISFIIIGIGVVGSLLASFAFGKPSQEKTKGLTYSTTIKNKK